MGYVDDLNYVNDPRNCERAPDRITVFNGDTEHELPTVFEVCPVCEGKGTHVNPAIDCNGLTAEDFHDDPDFRDNYMSGLYDQTCNCCGGLRVVKVVDRDRCDPALLALYDEEAEADAEYERISRAERAMGA